MPSIITEIHQWASKLPYWEQSALFKILQNEAFIDSDYDQLLQYLLEDAELAEQSNPRPEIMLSQGTGPIAQTHTHKTQLVKIFNARNVNALVPGQTLSFGSALTVVFGANGSGKSGYARVLGCVGFTRGDKEILPDVTDPECINAIPSGDIEVSDGNSNKIIHYDGNSRLAGLASFYVFDSTSVRSHLNEENAFSFSPAGLSVLTQLAAITDKVRERLQSRISEYSKPHDFDILFQDESDVRRLIRELGTTTDLKALQKLAALTTDEQRRLDELDIEIAKLKTQNIPDQIKSLKLKIDDLEKLIKRLNNAQEGLSDTLIANISNTIELCREHQSQAQKVGLDQFKSEYFTQTGSALWRQFIESAKALAESEQSAEKIYPRDGDHCLLCHQSLSTEARNLLLRLWEYLKGEAQTKMEKIHLVLEAKRKELVNIDLDFFDEQSVYYRHLHECDQGLTCKVVNFVESCRKRRENVLQMITTLSKVSLAPLVDHEMSEIKLIITKVKKQLDDLEKKNPVQEIAKLVKEQVLLKHRRLLGQYHQKMENYVKKQIWVQQASKIGGSTKHITDEYNDLFRRLVTERYLKQFEQILKDLGRPLKVKVQTKGKKGEALKQIVLEAGPSSQIEKAGPDKVLSEGEKRAVALADFLTEVALDEASSGIILDDPITSLDFEWKETITPILVQEAKSRQVVIFTHDLHFLYLLKKFSEREPVEMLTHWIKRGDNDGKPGYVFLENSPAMERDYRNTQRARDLHGKLKNAPPEEQEALIKEGFGAIRTTYEAFVIFDLFKEVVMRFNERISIGRLKDIIWDNSIVDEVVAKTELLSKYIEGHLHSDISLAQKPTPDMLLTEIEAFEALKKKFNELKKQNIP